MTRDIVQDHAVGMAQNITILAKVSLKGVYIRPKRTLPHMTMDDT
jgi:hypothetical protein